jgi:phosphatidylglycerol:prolipoprotein diacylglycerol transferase
MIPYFYVPYLHLGITTIDTHSAAVVTGLCLAHFRFLSIAPDRDRAGEISLYAVTAGIVVAHIAFLWLAEWRIPWSMAWFPLSGLLALPGFLAGMGAAAWRIRAAEVAPAEIDRWGEAAVRAFLPAWIAMKTGCFLLHDTPGAPAALPWAVEFPDGPRHDLSLYEIVWALTFLLVPIKKKARLVVTSYAALRIAIYWLRLEQHPIDLLLAAVLFAIGVFWPRLTSWLAVSSPSDPYPAGHRG